MTVVSTAHANLCCRLPFLRHTPVKELLQLGSCLHMSEHQPGGASEGRPGWGIQRPVRLHLDCL